MRTFVTSSPSSGSTWSAGRSSIPFHTRRAPWSSHAAPRRAPAHPRDTAQFAASNSSPLVALADHDDNERMQLAALLRRSGVRVLAVKTGDELADLVRARVIGPLHPACEPVAMVIADVVLAGVSGLDVLSDVRAADWTLPMIHMNDHRDPDDNTEADRLGVTAIFDKPFELAYLVSAACGVIYDQNRR